MQYQKENLLDAIQTRLENRLQEIYNVIEREPGIDNERLEALITVKALMAIAKDSSALSEKNDVYFINVQVNKETYPVPIHLEAYHKAGIPPEDHEKALLDALPKAFVGSYDVVVKSGKREAVKIFLSKLGGECIDARTRSAMDYAAMCDEKPITFFDRLTLCAAESEKLYGERHSYYSIFTVLLTKYWNLPYSKDTAAKSPCQDDGTFDPSCFELLHEHLNLVLPYDEKEDPTQWLTVLAGMGSKEQFVFVSFVIFSAIKVHDLQHASEVLQADRQFVLNAVTQNGGALQYASQILKANREFVLAAVTEYGSALPYASEELKDDRDVVLAAVTQNGGALAYASEGFKFDRGVVLAAVKQNGGALKYASQKLKANREFVLAAVKQNGHALKYATEELQREFILAEVKQNGRALYYAPEKLKADREIVLAAVTQNGRALQYASAELKADREIVLAAVTQSGWALAYASKELQADREIVLAALAADICDDSPLRYASGELQGDRQFVLYPNGTNLRNNSFKSIN